MGLRMKNFNTDLREAWQKRAGGVFEEWGVDTPMHTMDYFIQ